MNGYNIQVKLDWIGTLPCLVSKLSILRSKSVSSKDVQVLVIILTLGGI